MNLGRFGVDLWLAVEGNCICVIERNPNTQVITARVNIGEDLRIVQRTNQLVPVEGLTLTSDNYETLHRWCAAAVLYLQTLHRDPLPPLDYDDYHMAYWGRMAV